MPRRLTCKDALQGRSSVARGQELGATALMSRAQDAQERPGRPRAARGCRGEAERGERPVNVRPAERASHGRRAPGFQAERDARAKKAQERRSLGLFQSG